MGLGVFFHGQDRPSDGMILAGKAKRLAGFAFVRGPQFTTSTNVWEYVRVCLVVFFVYLFVLVMG